MFLCKNGFSIRKAHQHELKQRFKWLLEANPQVKGFQEALSDLYKYTVLRWPNEYLKQINRQQYARAKHEPPSLINMDNASVLLRPPNDEIEVVLVEAAEKIFFELCDKSGIPAKSMLQFFCGEDLIE